MKILLTPPQGATFDTHFPPALIDRLRAIGEVRLNPLTRHMTRDEIKAELADTDIVMTHWGSTQYDAEMLDCAPKLKMLAHCAGTVAHIASEEFYLRGIPVLSANAVMALYVAEGVLAYMLAGIRSLAAYDAAMKAGEWDRGSYSIRSLLDTEIGLIGLGTVGRCLLDLLRPFGCKVCVYDPYIAPDALDKWEFARLCDFDTAMSRPLVSIHASQTPETYHMINADALKKLPDGALLINTARGSLVDTEALIAELETGRIHAVLDVFEREWKPLDERLRNACKTQTLYIPHMAAFPAGARMTAEIIDDIERFVRGEPMRLTISHNQYLHMTQE